MTLLLIMMPVLGTLCFCIGWFLGHDTGYKEGLQHASRQWRRALGQRAILTIPDERKPLEDAGK